MGRQRKKFWAWLLMAAVLSTGCHPTQPFYFNEDGDLSHYLDVATKIEHPDLEIDSLDGGEYARAPLTLTNSEFEDFWELPLEDAVNIALKNSKVMRSFGQIRQLRQITATTPERLLSNPEFVPTIYDPAIQETSPTLGVEAALAAFDAQLNASLFWERADRPRNIDLAQFPFSISRFQQDMATGQVELSKTAAPGTQFFFRSVTRYDKNNSFARFVPSDWFQALEMEARHPLMRGAGTQVNRIPTILARIRTDISLAAFESGVREMVSSVERAYWELYFFYRNVEATKVGRDGGLRAWRQVRAKMIAGDATRQEEARANEQYWFFQSRVQEGLRDLQKAETRLRYVMGLAPTDGRLIRPSDELTTAKVDFEWHDILAEGRIRSVELRQQKWRIKQRELELIAARNQLLPQFDVVGLYRWLGFGDDLIEANRAGINFPNAGSLAFDELTEGDYQEWRFGFQGSMPLGFRRELAGVRHQQLQLAREKARIEDMELALVHQINSAVQDLEGDFVLYQTNLNRRQATQQEVERWQAVFEIGIGTGTTALDQWLDAQRRQAEAEIAYYEALVNYNVDIMELHLRKGSLLEYNGIYLAEGPWPGKAYYDAHAQARRRDASYYLDYGFTRPKVISRGEVQQHTRGEARPFDEIHDGQPAEIIPPPEPTLAPEPMPAPDADVEARIPTAGPVELAGPILAAPVVDARAAAEVSEDHPPKVKPAAFDWGGLGLNLKKSKPASSRISELRRVQYQQRKATDDNESHANQSAGEADRPLTSWKAIQR